MVLKEQRHVAVGFVPWISGIDGGSLQLIMILDKHSIMEDSHGGGFDERAIGGEKRGMKNDIKSLPASVFP
jgi:hypothetical protein